MITYILSQSELDLVVVLLSMFPPCTPVVMFLRMASQIPPWWQMALCRGDAAPVYLWRCSGSRRRSTASAF